MITFVNKKITEAYESMSLDDEYASAVRSNDKELYLKLLKRQAKLKMPNTKILDEDGLPLVVWHGGTMGSLEFSGLQSVFVPYGDVHFGRNEGISWQRVWNDSSLQATRRTVDGPWFIEDGYGNEVDKNGYETELEAKRHIPELEGRTVKPYFLNIENPCWTYDDQDDIHKEVPSDKKLRIAQNNYSSEGYDGNIYDNTGESGYSGRYKDGDEDDLSYVAYRPNQIKLAEPTYDINGKLIPLSRRFDLTNDDIRY